jgi:hypothetical protein
MLIFGGSYSCSKLHEDSHLPPPSYMENMPVDYFTHTKYCFIRKTVSVELGLILCNVGKHF